MWTKFIIAAAAAVPLLYLAMGHMMPALRLPIPWFLDPMQYPLLFALVQLVLVIPAIAAGNRFYRVGGKALWHRAPNMDSLIAIGTAAAVLYSLYSTWRIVAGDFAAAEQPVLRDGRCHHRPDPPGQDAGDRVQGTDVPGHQEADGARAQDRHR